jgi:tetratricopeptide (TPR) repeat protein
MTENNRHYLLEKRDPSSDRVTILFSEYLTKDQGVRSYAFRHLLSTLGLNIVYVRDPANQWYNRGIVGLGDDLASSAAALKDLCRREGFRQIGCVGASMGGYGALAFGRELDADAVLAFAPQTFLAPRYPRHNENMHHGSYLDLAEFDEPPAARTHVVISEDELYDLHGALRLRYWAEINLTMIRGASHLVPRALHNAGFLVRVLDDFCRTGNLSIPSNMIGAGTLIGARNELLEAVDRTYLLGVPYALQQLQGLLDRFPDSAGCHLWTGRASKAASKSTEAVYHLEKAIDLNSSLYEAAMELAYIHAGRGEWAGAIKNAMKAAALNPSYNNLRAEMLRKSIDAAEEMHVNGMTVEAEEIWCAIQGGHLEEEQIGPAMFSRLSLLGERLQAG